MGIRKKVAYVYPGIHKSGVGVLILDDLEVKKVAVGSVENWQVGPLLERLKLDELVVSTTKIHDRSRALVSIPEGTRKLRFAAPGWERKKVPVTDRTHPSQGVYVHNVWKLMFNDGITRKPTKVKDFRVDKFDTDWVLANSPKGIQNGRC